MMKFRISVLLVVAACGGKAHEIGPPPEPDRAGEDGGTDTDAATGAVGAPIVDPNELSGDAEPVFTDVAEEAGFTHEQATPGTQIGCRTERPAACPYSSTHMTGGAAAGDYDGDGLIDLYVTRLDAPGILYRNRGDGTFQDVTADVGLGDETGGNGAGWGDVDGDGDLDLYVTNLLGDRHHLYIQADGRFEEQAVARGAATDTGHRHEGFSVGFGDFDHDGYLDIHVTEWTNRKPWELEPNHTMLLRNRGATRPGHFDDVTAQMGVSMLEGPRANRVGFASTFADLDDDGRMDLAVVNDFRASRLFWGDAREGFIDGTIAARVGGDLNGMGSAIGDYDRDGDLDWFITAIHDPDYMCDDIECGWGTNGNRLYRNEGGRLFTDVTDLAGVREGGWGWGTAFFDYDNDGDLDLIMTNGVDFPNEPSVKFLDDRVRLWRNRGDGTFEDVAPEAGIDDPGDGKGLMVLDYDGDGDLDVFIARHAGRPALFRNDGGNDNGWLRVQLVGEGGNSAGIGARVSVVRRDGEPPMVREVRASGQFLGQSEAIAHFGLGSFAGAVHELEVRWPSGEVTRMSELESRQLLTVRE